MGKHRTQPIPRHDPRYRLLRDTRPHRMPQARYRLARLALAALDIAIGLAIATIIIAAIGGLYLGVTHKPLPSGIARMLGSHGTRAQHTTQAHTPSHATTPTSTAAMAEHSAHLAHIAHSHASPSAMPPAG